MPIRAAICDMARRFDISSRHLAYATFPASFYVAAGRVVTGRNLPRLFGSGHAGTHWKRECNDQQKP